MASSVVARVEGLHEPASSLVDDYIHMFRTGSIRYLDWTKLLTREEALAPKKKTNLKVNVVKWTAEAQGLVASMGGDDLGETALHSDYLICCALHRRAVAEHVSGILDFLVHEKASELYCTRGGTGWSAGIQSSMQMSICGNSWLMKPGQDVLPLAVLSSQLMTSSSSSSTSYCTSGLCPTTTQSHWLPLPRLLLTPGNALPLPNALETWL